MSETRPTVRVNVVVEMTAASLQTIVDTAKQAAGRDEKGVYRVDTADRVGEMISRYLLETDFEAFVRDARND